MLLEVLIGDFIEQPGQQARRGPGRECAVAAADLICAAISMPRAAPDKGGMIVLTASRQATD